MFRNNFKNIQIDKKGMEKNRTRISKSSFGVLRPRLRFGLNVESETETFGVLVSELKLRLRLSFAWSQC
jgi:hypothetical protein